MNNNIRGKIFVSRGNNIDTNIMGSPLENWNSEDILSFTLYMELKLISTYRYNGTLRLCLLKHEDVDGGRGVKELELGKIDLSNMSESKSINEGSKIVTTIENFDFAIKINQYFNNIYLIGKGIYEIALYFNTTEKEEVLDAWQFNVR